MGEIVDIHCTHVHRRQHIPHTHGRAHLQFLGHSTTLLTTRHGKRVMIDPFLADNPRCPADLKDPGRIDYIVLTHGHFDHTADTLPLVEKYGATVFCNWELGHLLLKDGLPEANLQMMNKGGGMQLPGSDNCWVYFTHAMHSSSYTLKDGSTHYAGEPCGIVIQLENGDALYHAGDTALFSDMALIREQFAPRLALLPIGDRFTMDAEDAAQAVRLIAPQVVIPIHFGTFEGLLAPTADEFVERLKTAEVKVLPLEPGGAYDF